MEIAPGCPLRYLVRLDGDELRFELGFAILEEHADDFLYPGKAAASVRESSAVGALSSARALASEQGDHPGD